MMSKLLEKRSELVFLYDIRDGNPNGDPMDENKPRIDEESGINIVTDVRLKRTIRDYLYDSLGEEILIRTIQLKDSLAIQDGKTRALDFCDTSKKTFQEQLKSIENNVLEQCIDVRLFGVTLPIELKDGSKKKTTSFKRTGPVQFNMGRSLHQVEIKHIKGTGAFASKAGEGVEREQQTFRDEYILHYSLISFHGLINENTAQHTSLSENDVQLLLEGIWNGTKGLISRSKMGQMPRLLLRVEYNTKNFHIGDLDKGIKLTSDLEEVSIRSPTDYFLDVDKLLQNITAHKDKIDNIFIKFDADINFRKAGKIISLHEAIKLAIGKEVIEINFKK